MPTFSSDGVEIAYLDQSPAGFTHPTPVLLIHGFASNVATNWEATGWVGDLVQAGYRVIAFDNRGHGRSQKLYDLADYGAPLMAEDARRLLDHLGVEDAHVIGYSMGARIAAFLSLAHPERVASVVLGGLGINLVRGLGGTPEIAAALEARSVADVKDPGGRVFRVFAEQTRSDLKALAACIRSARAPITAEAIGMLKPPALIAVGENDAVAGSPAELLALVPGARCFIIPGREHMKAVGDRAFKGQVLAFLEEQDLRRDITAA